MGSFKEVVGHKDVIHYMQGAVSGDKVVHAYILNGEKGSGKKMLAKLFAMTLQCEEKGTDPCGTCRSCRLAEQGSHPDIIQVKHEKPTSIGVSDIREQITKDVQIKPYYGPYKIYIISEADLMTKEAQNALLKTVEEPPQYAILFLLTENAQKLLPTITSRCVMLKLRNIRDTLIRKYLMEQMQLPDYKANMCAAFAQGNLGRAILLASSEHFNEIREEAIHLLKHMDDMEMDEIVKAIERISAYKLEINDYFDIMTIWFRDVLLYKATKDVNRIVFSEELSSIKERAQRSSYEGIERILESLEKAKSRLKANVNFDLTMELLLLTIKEN